MKKITSALLIAALFLFFTMGCSNHSINLTPSMPSHDTKIAFPLWPLAAFIGASAVLLLATAKYRSRSIRLTPEGKAVKLVMHEEAPGSAELLGDIQTKSRRTVTCVKNDMRNITARMGGNFVVVDTIHDVVYGGTSREYKGSGRAYYIEKN